MPVVTMTQYLSEAPALLRQLCAQFAASKARHGGWPDEQGDCKLCNNGLDWCDDCAMEILQTAADFLDGPCDDLTTMRERVVRGAVTRRLEGNVTDY